ncbi:MAG: iron-containing alcohol dehydrogenase [Firmicutes bacterium]|nr:iron-containing alcohol dehydrogenase [Bacillota bacterium]
MLNFDYQNRTRIIFGKETHKDIGTVLKPYSNRVLLHYGGGSIKRTGVYDDVTTSLKNSGIEYVELGGVRPNPRLELVHEGIELCRQEGIDFILAVGGGSVIDSAKAIALGVNYSGDVWDFFMRKAEPGEVLPLATILTLPAAGSESSTSTVITNWDEKIKRGFGSEKIRPVFSIMNPELYFTLPDEQIAYGVCDMMSHIFERYFTNTLNTDLTDGLCETTLRTIMKNALLLKQDNKNYDAWAEVSFAGNIAHNGLLGLGREMDWASHAMEHELSAIYDVAHGAGLAVVTPAWMKYVYKTNMPMFVQFAVNVMGVEGSFRDPEAIVLEGIERLKEFFVKMGLPVTMQELGIKESDFELMAKKATGLAYGKETGIGGLRKLKWEDVVAIYQLAR